MLEPKRSSVTSGASHERESEVPLREAVKGKLSVPLERTMSSGRRM